MSQHLPPLAEQLQAWRNLAVLTGSAVGIWRWWRRRRRNRRDRQSR